MRSASTLCVASAILVALTPPSLDAQRYRRSGVGVVEVVAMSVGQGREHAPLLPIREDSSGSGMVKFLVGGAVFGGAVGAILASSFKASFCGEPSPGVTCSGTSGVEGALIGAAVGLAVGWIAWQTTRPAPNTRR